jgi:hypothetical protein
LASNPLQGYGPAMFDTTKRRPIEIRVIDRREEGGASEDDATASNGVSADALVLMRLLLDSSDQVSMSFSAIEGSTGNELAFEPLFNFWLGLTSHSPRGVRLPTTVRSICVNSWSGVPNSDADERRASSCLPGDMPSA